MNRSTRVAFLGLGAMGAPMSRNLIKAGFPLTVWNRSTAKAQELAAEGARVAATPKEAAENAEVVLTCLPTQDEVRDVLTRPDGILAGLTPGKTLVDCSTIDPTASADLIALVRERGIEMLEAPLSGGTIGAKAGTLTMMVGGDEAALERVRPVLLAMAKNIFHVGGPGAGQTLKLCNNLISGSQTVALAEAYAILKAAGVDAKLATDVFSVSSANCVAIQQRVPVPGVQPHAPASNGWQPGFATEWMAKDLWLVQQFARTLNVPLLQTAVNFQALQEAIQAGYGKLDQSVIGKVMAERIRTAEPAAKD
ncbi:MAG TPA: NAD(P)-dependent oxidoreductase [Candidatus Acidoferrum sp.]|jgi:3-hydroxyisobutyrate dehydrogenase|nr:NAD(P)-dependent oxidoreductase [Candidatus Acidoferrum sp.]